MVTAADGGALEDQLAKVQHRILAIVDAYNALPAPSRNFTSSYKGGTILWQHNDGRVLDPRTFLPSQTIPCAFVPGEEFTLSYSKITFQENEQNRAHFPLTLFHEIGHTHIRAAYRNKHLALLGKHAASLLWYKACRMPLVFLDYLKGNGFAHRDLAKITGGYGDHPLAWVEQKERLHAENERDAWAYSLRTLRTLEQQGWDVFNGITAAQIRGAITAKLATYELTHQLSMLLLSAMSNRNIARQLIGKTPIIEYNLANPFLKNKQLFADAQRPMQERETR